MNLSIPFSIKINIICGIPPILIKISFLNTSYLCKKPKSIYKNQLKVNNQEYGYVIRIFNCKSQKLCIIIYSTKFILDKICVP